MKNKLIDWTCGGKHYIETKRWSWWRLMRAWYYRKKLVYTLKRKGIWKKIDYLYITSGKNLKL